MAHGRVSTATNSKLLNHFFSLIVFLIVVTGASEGIGRAYAIEVGNIT